MKNRFAVLSITVSPITSIRIYRVMSFPLRTKTGLSLQNTVTTRGASVKLHVISPVSSLPLTRSGTEAIIMTVKQVSIISSQDTMILRLGDF